MDINVARGESLEFSNSAQPGADPVSFNWYLQPAPGESLASWMTIDPVSGALSGVVPSNQPAGRYCVQIGADNGCVPAGGTELLCFIVPPSEQNCEDLTPPAPVQRTFASPSSPIVVPSDFVGLHANVDVPPWGGGGVVAPPAFPYESVRLLGATGTRSNGEVVEEPGFWNTIETSPGVYDWSAVDDWMGDIAQGRPVRWVIASPPEFYQKYPNEPSRWESYPGSGSPPLDANLPQLTAFVAAVRQRYSNVVEFQVLNEPLFNWDTPPTDYTASGRASPAWLASAGQDPAFFTGSATDGANMIAATKQGAGSVPVSFAGFESPRANTVTRLTNAPVTIGPYAGQTAGQVADRLDVHSYDFDGLMMNMIDEIDQFRSLSAPSMTGKPLRVSEGGRWLYSEPAADVELWFLIAAVQGATGADLYAHGWKDDADHHMGGFNTPELIAMMNRVSALNGATICQGAQLTNGTLWVVLSTGETWNLGG